MSTYSKGLLTIRKTKFGKTRLVPLHPSARRALRQYARQRRAFIGPGTAVRFFVSSQGGPLSVGAVMKTFRFLRRRVGLHAFEHCDEPKSAPGTESNTAKNGWYLATKPIR